jgi:hypothetical protein
VWEELRRQLGGEFSYGLGHWFCVSHEDVCRLDGRPYSYKTHGSGRRVVLATRHGPNATLFARSCSVESRFAHSAHKHPDGPGRCRIDKNGWINLGIPVSVPVVALCDATYSCEEPEGTGFLAELERAIAL